MASSRTHSPFDLVVTTTNFRDGGWLDLGGSPLTDAGTLTQRFRRPTFAVMEIDELMLDDELIEYVCLENQRFKR